MRYSGFRHANPKSCLLIDFYNIGILNSAFLEFDFIIRAESLLVPSLPS